MIVQTKSRGKALTPKGGSVARDTLVTYLGVLLNAHKIKDYCPNGLQVEGKLPISRIALAVTASQNAIDQAVAWQADALLVHHGLFWKNDNPSLVGPLRSRVTALLKAEINLLAYHLPLDIHPLWGNNKALGQVLGFAQGKPVSQDGLIWCATLKRSLSPNQLSQLVHSKLGRQPLVVGNLQKSIKTVAWCTGGAQGYFADALALGADAYLSGEISEQTTHLARETGTVFVAAGHHATELYGVQSLGGHLAQHFGVQVQFFDDANPV